MKDLFEPTSFIFKKVDNIKGIKKRGRNGKLVGPRLVGTMVNHNLEGPTNIR